MDDAEELKRKRQEEREERRRQQAEMKLRRMERERVEKERRKARQRRKNITPIIMLTAGAIVSIVMLLDHYPLNRMLPVLLCVLIVFDIVGELIRWMFDRFALQNEEAADAAKEGEVIEKQQNGEPDGQVVRPEQAEAVGQIE